MWCNDYFIKKIEAPKELTKLNNLFGVVLQEKTLKVVKTERHFLYFLVILT